MGSGSYAKLIVEVDVYRITSTCFHDVYNLD
jgi:hypothetical protein